MQSSHTAHPPSKSIMCAAIHALNCLRPFSSVAGKEGLCGREIAWEQPGSLSPGITVRRRAVQESCGVPVELWYKPETNYAMLSH